MTKQILTDYIDACELIKETERDIRKLRKQEIVHDKVSGSNPEFPYQSMNFNVEGAVEISLDEKHLEKEKELLKQRKKRAEEIKLEVETWMNTIPLRMQRIIRYKVFERASWDETAVKLGSDCSGESIRKEFERFLEKK